jgi:WhiB family redox-sensing transcriptional regulator
VTAQRDWSADANCAGLPTEMFVNDEGSAGIHYDPRVFAVCRGCLVRTDCLLVAMNDTTLMGVWGGTTEVQRRKLRRVA